MNRTTKFAASSAAVGVAMALTVAAPAFAWHPKGVITKYVQNQSTNSAMLDANDVANAVTAHTGDVLKYTIVITNTGASDSRGYNDMYYTKLTDTLPTGVELVSDTSKRTITEDLGTIKAGQKVTKEYVVKVTSTKDKDVIDNKACFTGDSQVKDNPQSGCDIAKVVVTVPVTPDQPKTPEQPKPEVKGVGTDTPATLPATGPEGAFATAGTIGVLGYVGNVLRLKYRTRR
ncbi:MAG TPA: hypothetical protein VLE73_01000 [Candidatus Saccharimonadales bacterium]|nr:hypothetical protein [Candidatus Saccharimonadales bacterium]